MRLYVALCMTLLLGGLYSPPAESRNEEVRYEFIDGRHRAIFKTWQKWCGLKNPDPGVFRLNKNYFPYIDLNCRKLPQHFDAFSLIRRTKRYTHSIMWAKRIGAFMGLFALGAEGGIYADKAVGPILMRYLFFIAWIVFPPLTNMGSLVNLTTLVGACSMPSGLSGGLLGGVLSSMNLLRIGYLKELFSKPLAEDFLFDIENDKLFMLGLMNEVRKDCAIECTENQQLFREVTSDKRGYDDGLIFDDE
jgi:hypothetical protein